MLDERTTAGKIIIGFDDSERDRAALDEAADDDAEQLLIEGDPGTMLAEQSERLGLLAVGSRGYGPLLGGYPGSRRTPTIVVPRGVDSPFAARARTGVRLQAARDG